MKKILLLGREVAPLKEAAEKLAGDGRLAEEQAEAEKMTKRQALVGTGALVEVGAYNDLAFWIGGKETQKIDKDGSTNLASNDNGVQAQVTCRTTGRDIKEYDKILVLSTSLGHKENYIFSALACYCRKCGVEILDDNFTNLDGKLYAMWRFWEKGVPVPKTAFGPVEFLTEKLTELGGVAVLKSVQGTKGKDNYLVHSAEELREIMGRYVDTEGQPTVRFILQEFMPNDGDYRIVVTQGQPKLAIYRQASGDDFRNNTSLGGTAKLVPLAEVDAEVLEMAQQAAAALDIKIAGADILQNKATGKYAVLEVNRTPQLVSGAFTEEKLGVLRELID